MEMFTDLIKQRDSKQSQIDYQHRKIEELNERISSIHKFIKIEEERIKEMDTMIDILRERIIDVPGKES